MCMCMRTFAWLLRARPRPARPRRLPRGAREVPLLLPPAGSGRRGAGAQGGGGGEGPPKGLRYT